MTHSASGPPILLLKSGSGGHKADVWQQLTLGLYQVQALETAAPQDGVEAALGEAALAAGKHGSWRHDPSRWHLA